MEIDEDFARRMLVSLMVKRLQDRFFFFKSFRDKHTVIKLASSGLGVLQTAFPWRARTPAAPILTG